MRYLTIIFLFLFVCTNQVLFSQKIQSQLEVIWKDKEIYLSNFCGKTKVPYLVLKYINTSNDSLYFYEANNPYMDDHYYHQLIEEPLLISYTDDKFLCDSIWYWYYESIGGFRETENEYNVFIDEWGWIVTDKHIKKAPLGYDDLQDLFVTFKLNKVTSRLTKQEYYLPQKDSMAQLCDFCYPDKHYVNDTILGFSHEEILQSIYARMDSIANPEFANIIYNREYDSEINRVQSKFITIPPHGIYSKEYDLTHFKIVGGTYNFIYSPYKTETSFTFLRPEFRFKNHEGVENTDFTYHFPEKYKGYKLYSDKIKEIMVKIEIE